MGAPACDWWKHAGEVSAQGQSVPASGFCHGPPRLGSEDTLRKRRKVRGVSLAPPLPRWGALGRSLCVFSLRCPAVE